MTKKAKKTAQNSVNKNGENITHKYIPPRRRNRQVIYLNDDEMAAINLYCDKFKCRSRSALIREAVMLRVLTVLDENQPTLF